MDPDALLEELRELAQEAFDHGEDPVVLADTFATKFSELDEWLSKGKDLPEDWDR